MPPSPCRPSGLIAPAMEDPSTMIPGHILSSISPPPTTLHPPIAQHSQILLTGSTLLPCAWTHACVCVWGDPCMRVHVSLLTKDNKSWLNTMKGGELCERSIGHFKGFCFYLGPGPFVDSVTESPSAVTNHTPEPQHKHWISAINTSKSTINVVTYKLYAVFALLHALM